MNQLDLIALKKTNEQRIGDVIKQLFKTYHIQSRVNEVQIKELWEQVMGKTILHYTSDIKLRDGILTLYLTSAPLKQDLAYMKENIKSRLNEEFGEVVVKDIRIR